MFVIRRSSHNPLISPVSDHPWEARATFNASPVRIKNLTHLLYRAVGRPDALVTPNAGFSTIGKAITLDGKHIQNRRQFIVPEEVWEKFGCEDPRATLFEGTYYVFYTALSEFPPKAAGIRVGVAVSKDLEHIDEKHLVTPFNAKAFALFPERVGGKVTAIFTAHTDEPPAKICIVQCKEVKDLWNPKFWEKWHTDIDKNRINPVRFDSDHVEVGAPPLKTKDGWLLLYAYIQDYFKGGNRVFGIEALLLDKTDPRTIVGRTKGPIMVPEEIYERYGMVEDVIFPTGALLTKERLDIFYGAADTTVCRATVHLGDLLAEMKPEKRKALVKRSTKNPILTPSVAPTGSRAWEAKAVFNPAAIELDGSVHMLYRAMGADNTSVLGYARSKDGVKFERHTEPAYIPRAPFEMKLAGDSANSGCEDPRLTRIGSTLYMTYTAYDSVNPPKVAATTISVKDFLAKRFDKWSMPAIITPDKVDDKDMCLLPKKIDGQYMLFHRVGGQICADFLPSLDFEKMKGVNRCIEVMGPRPGLWDSRKVGIAGPPIETKHGWLLIYHGVSRSMTYRLGAVLLDLKNPTVVIARTVGPIFEPTEEYEKKGQVPNVVFSCGAVMRGDTLSIYYGGGDSVIGVANVSMKELFRILLPKDIA